MHLLYLYIWQYQTPDFVSFYIIKIKQNAIKIISDIVVNQGLINIDIKIFY